MTEMVNRILVYVDGTEESITAAQYAICLARTCEAELTALYVVNTRALNDLLRSHIFFKEEQEEYSRDLEEDAERYLNHVRDLARQKAVAIETVKRSGSVHKEIRELIKEKDIDLLVIGEISRLQSRRDEFYNEVERAMRSVECSVLISKDPERVWSLYENLT
ncbi:MAG: universal stress protein [Spirochaetales bacterium]|nr:universal stress protein [Spirochaetales bacterium]